MIENDALRIKGINFLGFESSCERGGSWSTTRLSDTFRLLRKNGFNALRVPIAIEGCDSDDELETFVQTAGDHGLLVAINMHTLRPGIVNRNGYVGGEDGFERLKASWERQASMFCNETKYWNVFAADLLENPHGSAAPLEPL